MNYPQLKEPKRSNIDPHFGYETGVHILLEDPAYRWSDFTCSNFTHFFQKLTNWTKILKSPKNVFHAVMFTHNRLFPGMWKTKLILFGCFAICWALNESFAQFTKRVSIPHRTPRVIIPLEHSQGNFTIALFASAILKLKQSLFTSPFPSTFPSPHFQGLVVHKPLLTFWKWFCSFGFLITVGSVSSLLCLVCTLDCVTAS